SFTARGTIRLSVLSSTEPFWNSAMVRSFHRLRSVVGVLILVTVAAGVVMAAPILPRKPQLPDEVRCLTGLKRVSIAIDPLPQELVAAKVGADRLQAVL